MYECKYAYKECDCVFASRVSVHCNTHKRERNTCSSLLLVEVSYSNLVLEITQ